VNGFVVFVGGEEGGCFVDCSEEGGIVGWDGEERTSCGVTGVGHGLISNRNEKNEIDLWARVEGSVVDTFTIKMLFKFCSMLLYQD
jgi:hypothetical protein